VDLEWSPRADREVMQLRDYIAQDSLVYANQFIERLIMAVENLQIFPLQGRPLPEAGYQDHIREIIFRGYRIIYRIHNEELLQVVSVLHGARNMADLNPLPWQV